MLSECRLECATRVRFNLRCGTRSKHAFVRICTTHSQVKVECEMCNLLG